MTDKIIELIKILGSLAQILIALIIAWHKWLRRGEIVRENAKLKEEIAKLKKLIEGIERG